MPYLYFSLQTDLNTKSKTDNIKNNIKDVKINKKLQWTKDIHLNDSKLNF